MIVDSKQMVSAEVPEISVIMSVHNGEAYLKQAIDSILDQTFSDFEFIIVNDASTDRTEEILRGYRDPRIVLLQNELNLGLTKSLNKGIGISRGLYIARMDADDISYPSRFEEQLKILKSNPEIGLVGSWTELIDENDCVIGTWKGDDSPELIYYILNFRNCLTHSSVLFRKDLLLRYGAYDENIKKAQDYELWQRLSKFTKIYKINKYLVKWRKTDNSITALSNSAQANTIRVIFLNNFKFLLETQENIDILNFIRDNIELAHIDMAISERELIRSIQVLRMINDHILKIAPSSLNKRILYNFAKFYYYNYIYNIYSIIGLKKIWLNVELNAMGKLRLTLFILAKDFKTSLVQPVKR